MKKKEVMKPQVIREMPSSSTKDPILPSFSQQPFLFQLHGTKEHTLSFINPFNGSKEERSMPEMQGKICLSCFGEWVLLLHTKTKEMSILNLFSGDEIKLPAMSEEFDSLGWFAFSSSPTCPKCVIITVAKDEDFIIYYRPNDKKWTKIRPVHDVHYRGDIAISEGKIYASLEESYIVVINLDSLPTGAIVGEIIQTPRSTRGEKYHLVTSSKRIFLVSVKFSSRLVTDVNIYALEASKLAERKYRLLDGVLRSFIRFEEVFERVESINGRVFLLGGDYNISISANHAGVRRNSMYLFRPDEEDGLMLYTICMDDQTTSFKVLLPEDTNAWERLFWVVPSRSRNLKCRTTKTSTALFSEGEERTNDISISWADIPEGIVQELLSFLPLADRIRLVSVCKLWSSFLKFIKDSKVSPWLICSSDGGSLKVFDPFYGVEHSLQMKWLGSTEKLTLHFSKDGWVIASDRDRCLFILNPLTRQSIKVPIVMYDPVPNMSFSFSSIPTFPDCIVLGVYNGGYYCVLYTWNRGRESWSRDCEVEFTDIPFRLSSSTSCPVFFRDEFYILGRKGDLLVFNLTKKECHFLDVPAPIHSEAVPDIEKGDCYLFELEGELIYVFTGSTIESCFVYKLDRSKMVWVELEDLGDMKVFLSRKNSMSRPNRNGIYANGILFPRFHGKDSKQPVFYSVQNHASLPKSEDMREIMNCVWFEPNLFHCKSKKNRGNV